MAARQAIVLGIDQRVQSSRVPDYKLRRIGITHDVQRRYGDWGRPPHFLYWEPNSLQDAQAKEVYFIHRKGMVGGTGGEVSNQKKAFIYIF